MNTYILAAIDIGSNAIRLLINTIYETEDTAKFNKTSLVRVPIRLGQDVFTNGKISKPTLERLVDAMTAYKLLMKVYNVKEYKAFATSAMRECKNAEDIINTVKKKSGVKIEVISGETEAKAIFSSSSELKAYLESEQYYLFVDVGGGSTEISLLNKGKVLHSKSFPIGTVRLLNNKMPDDYLATVIKPWVENIIKDIKEVNIIGSGGNINYLFKSSKEGKYLTDLYIDEQYIALKKMSYEERIKEYNMKTDRADVIVPALEIYNSIMKYAKATKLYVPKIGVADGMINLMYENIKKLREKN